MSEALPSLTIPYKTPRKWGEAQGEEFREQINNLAELAPGLVAAYLPDWSKQDIDKLCTDQTTALWKYDRPSYTELCSTARAAGIHPNTLVLLNLFTDLRDFAAAKSSEDSGCSAFAVRTEQMSITAQTIDTLAMLEPYLAVLHFEKAPLAPRVLTVVGCLGMAGVNAAGVAVVVNNLNTAETNRRGLPWSATVRRMLRGQTALDAQRALLEHLPSSGHNYVIGDQQLALNLETTGQQVDVTACVNQSGRAGALAHTNHYLGRLVDTQPMPLYSPTSQPRLAAMQNYFDHDPPAAEAIWEEMFVDGTVSEHICRPTESPYAPYAAATIGGLVINHLDRTAIAYRGNRPAEATMITWEY